MQAEKIFKNFVRANHHQYRQEDEQNANNIQPTTVPSTVAFIILLAAPYYLSLYTYTHSTT
jgi:hypothetical protein